MSLTELDPGSGEVGARARRGVARGERAARSSTPIARPSRAARAIREDAAEAARLLDLFLLEKALYEICYEAANRPHWVRIPLKGVTSLLGTGGDR